MAQIFITRVDIAEKVFKVSEVRGQGRESYSGGGIHFDGVAGAEAHLC